MKSVIFLAFFFITIRPAFAAHLHKEKEYQEAWCKAAGGVTEYVLDDGARVDCLTEEFAIEFDFAEKWAESAGQALFYGLKTGRKSGVVLIMENGAADDRYLNRLGHLARRYEFAIWTMRP